MYVTRYDSWVVCQYMMLYVARYDNTLKHMKVFKDTNGPTVFYLGYANHFSSIPVSLCRYICDYE